MLVTEDFTFKVADFGLARKIYDSIYRPSGVSSELTMCHVICLRMFVCLFCLCVCFPPSGSSADKVDVTGDYFGPRVHDTE